MENGDDNQMTENMQKFENYKVQFKKLELSLKYNFYLEAIFIEYAIMEDRAESILKHSGKYEVYLKNRKGHFPTIDSKINYIKKLAEPKSALLHKYFCDELLDDVLKWKEERNALIHALVKQPLTKNNLKEFSEKGYELVKTLRNKVNNYNRAVERQHKKGEL